MRKHAFDDIEMVLLEKVSTLEELDKTEIRLIAEFRSKGEADLNVSDGGGQFPGWWHVLSPEQREKSMVNSHTPEANAKRGESIRAAWKNRKGDARKPWNKGLTKDDPRIARGTEKMLKKRGKA